MTRTARLPRNILSFLLLIASLVPVASASGPYTVGSSNTVSADPNITRPSTTPCVVTLFTDAQFYDFNVENFTYTPPSACPGPWAKVILESDINLNAGIQYDRTANYWLGPVNIYFGTTAEPSNIGPSWHVENDLTDYSSIFYTAQSGQADIGNTLCCGLTSTIYASASLEFYPLAPGETAPVSANVVLPLSAGPSGGTVALSSTSNSLSGTFTMPTNVQAAYLDVYAQGQSQDDEFWYTCVPNDVSGELFSCGNTGFRETEITIDGQPAGVAPVFPWIFTGGIDPYLWLPIPGVQTLNFTPYRVNLTPFAGLLSNGQPHTVALSVYNVNNYFSVTASLLLYLDSGSTQTTGAITQNTLTAPNPVVTENLNVQPTYIKGTVDVSSKRSFVISGYVNTSHGTVTTKVSQTVSFSNNQFFNITASVYTQDISQGTTVNSNVTTSQPGTASTVYNQTYTFPLTVNYSQVFPSRGDATQTTKADQTYQLTTSTTQSGRILYNSTLTNAAQHADTLDLVTFGNSNQSASQQYNSYDSTGAAYNCAISAAANALTAFSPGCAQ